MDQIKAQLAIAIKYGFWIGSVVVLLGSLGIWYMTTSKLAVESASQTTKINQSISTVKSVEDELSKHANDLSHAEMNKLIAVRQEQVLQSWKTLFDRQRGILTWPEADLTKNFVDEFRDLIPIERFVSFPTDEADEKETTLLVTYQRYIKNALPDIAKIASAEWTADFENSGAGMMGMGSSGMDQFGGTMGVPDVDIRGVKDGPLVKWSPESQSTLLTDLFPWRAGKRRPTTLEVYYSQENLWVLKQLLQIIAKVNGEAKQAYQAKIHEISKIGIGSSVNFKSGNISAPGAGMMMGGMDPNMMGGTDYGSMMGGMDGEMSGSMDPNMMGVTIDPADNRYVNEALEPIAGSALREALTSNKPADVGLAIAKRVPVMLSLKMDQRAVPELLAACGSAPLMVEVKQVRLLPPGESNSQSDMSGGMSDMSGGMDMGMGGGMGAPTLSTGPVVEFPLDMSVEVYGLINIYNPPDPIKLGLDQVTKDNVDELLDDAPKATTVIDELPTPTPPAPAVAPDAGVPATDVPATTPPAAAPENTTPADAAAAQPAPVGAVP